MTELTERQKEIMQLLMKGHTPKEIAKISFIANGTVRAHVRNACKKLNARTVIQCVAIIAKTEAAHQSVIGSVPG